ncbi:MAG: hypothetical protein HW401_642 [Parcubacteria group bacterium]|nr:hypothetical protein [Parcubacteria group bacterium]
MQKDGENKENYVLVEDVVKKATADGGVTIIAGALEQGCVMTNLALLLASPEKKVTIIINDIPHGPGIPEEIRKGWVGAIISGALGPFTTSASPIVSESSDKAIFVKGFAIETSVALESLKIINVMSWKWFLNKKLSEYLFFNEECCRIIT